VISVHRRQFQALERYSLAADDPLACAGRIKWAFDVAARRHPGLLVSAQLEQRLRELGIERVGRSGAARRTGRPERVLHVLTQAYEFGGHTRVVERWMLLDRERTPTVALTGQGDYPLPPTLQSAAREAGGAVVELPRGSLLSRAWNLRALAEQHDLVVIHHHPNDVVPALAFAQAEGRPATILFNHASDRTWAGVGISDVIANLWDHDDVNTRVRRGAVEEASLVLPIPVVPGNRVTRSQARSNLGLDPDLQVVLSVGSAYKVAPVLEPSFTELLVGVAQASPRTLCLALGPEPDGAWEAVSRATGGRVVALGRRDNAVASMLLAAADVLVDTWPASGATTLLDAALAGLPVVSLGDGRAELASVRPPSGSLGGAVVHASTPSAVADAVAQLLADGAGRTALGGRALDYVEANHLRTWPAQLQAVVDRAVERHGAAAVPMRDPAPAATEWECVLHLLHAAAGDTVSLGHTLLDNHGDLQPSDRAGGHHDAEAVATSIVSSFDRPPRRAVAAPALEPVAIAELLAEVTSLSHAGEIESCAVVIPEAELSRAVAMFEAEMGGGSDVEIQLVAADGIESIAEPDDLVLA